MCEVAVGYSSVFTLITTALPQFGKQRLGMRSNLNLMCLFGFGSIGSYAAGALRQRTGSYAMSFLLNSAAWMLILLCIAAYILSGKARGEREVGAPAANEA